MTDQQSPESTAAEWDYRKRRKDRRIKLGFLAVVVIVGGAIYLRQYFGTEIGGFQTDLDAALVEAKAENRLVLAVIHDRPPGHQFEKLRKIFRTKGNKKVLESTNVITVSTYLAKGDPLAVACKIERYPTTLLLSADGKLLDSRENYIAETALPGMIYAGFRPPGWNDDPAAAAETVGIDGRKLVVLLRGESASRRYVEMVEVVSTPEAKQAFATAGVATACGTLDPKSPLVKKWAVTQLPTLLLVSASGNVVTRRKAVIAGEDSIERFLRGSTAP